MLSSLSRTTNISEKFIVRPGPFADLLVLYRAYLTIRKTHCNTSSYEAGLRSCNYR